jgi:hypothetical protein
MAYGTQRPSPGLLTGSSTQVERGAFRLGYAHATAGRTLVPYGPDHYVRGYLTWRDRSVIDSSATSGRRCHSSLG